jgi:tRNA G18 (ribose-2'-O)-methylase SpoU
LNLEPCPTSLCELRRGRAVAPRAEAETLDLEPDDAVVVPADDPRLAPYAMVGNAAWLRSQGLFVAEGRLVVERLIEAGCCAIHSVLVTPAARRALGGALDRLESGVWICSQDTLRHVTGFDFHRGCLALAWRPAPIAIDPWLQGDHVLLALEGVGNPDNVGGLFRTAAAFAAGGVLVTASTADPLYRKSVRTSMGTVLRVPWAAAEPWPSVLTTLRSHGYRVAALTPQADAMPIDRFASHDYRRVVLLVGAEGAGLTDEALAAADHRVRIPIAAGIDSLNVTVAAGIALHALNRTLNPEP